MKNLLYCVILCPLFAMFATGCASHYHVGYNYLNEEKKVLHNVHKKNGDELYDIEIKTIDKIRRYNLEGLRSLFGPKLSEALPETSVAEITDALSKRYQFGETYVRLKISGKAPQGMPEFVDNFQLYDFIQSQFILEGTPGAGAILYFTKIDGVPKLCGFYIVDLPADRHAEKKVFGALAPETLDKAGMFSSREWRFGDVYVPRK